MVDDEDDVEKDNQRLNSEGDQTIEKEDISPASSNAAANNVNYKPKKYSILFWVF